MAKAKPKKPGPARFTSKFELQEHGRRLTMLQASVDAVINITNDYGRRLDSLDEAICPRVAARLNKLEQGIGILDREHDALGKVVNDNAEKSDKLQAHVSALIARRPSPLHNPAFSESYGTKEAYQRLWTDLFKEEPVPRTSHLDANEAWLVSNIVGIAGSRMSRLARAELIGRLRAMNGPVGP